MFLYVFCLDSIPLLKHQSFKEENEWRIVLNGLEAENLKKKKFLTNRNEKLVPFVLVDSDQLKFKESLQSIKIGPHTESAAQEKAMKLYLESHGFDEVGVSSSQIPLLS